MGYFKLLSMCLSKMINILPPEVSYYFIFKMVSFQKNFKLDSQLPLQIEFVCINLELSEIIHYKNI